MASTAPHPTSEQTFEQLLAARVGGALTPTAGIVAGLYIVYTAGYWFWPPEGRVAELLLASTGVTALGFLAAFFWLWGREDPGRHAHAVMGIMGLVVGWNAWLGLAALELPEDTVNLMIFAIAVGSVTLSRAWALGLGLANLGVWGAVAFQAAPEPPWEHYGFALVAATAVGGVVHTSRRASLRREHRLRLAASRSARELDDNVRRTATLLSVLPDAVVRIDTEGVCEDLVLPQGVRSDFQADELLGRPLGEVFPAVIVDQVLAQVRETLDSGRLTTREYRLRFEGDPVDLELRAVPHGEREVAGIVRDVSQRKRLDALRDDFVATVSHELRTPLTSIHGSLRLIAGGVAGELGDEVRDLVGIATENSDRLRRLIDDLLDMRQLEAGALELRPEHLDLAPLLRRCLAANAGYAESHGVRLELVEPLPAAPVRVDPDRLQQVMANLLSNAIKFSPEGERVTVELARRGRYAVISVIDRGPGIAADFQARVFQRFAQADSGTSRRSAGTGLGLAICKRLVEASAGRIGFESKAGKGARFDVELPLDEHPPIAPDREA